MESDRSGVEERVLLLAPTGKDAAMARTVLERADVSCSCCQTLDEVCRQLEVGAGALLISEEAIVQDHTGCLTGWMKRQPRWSDMPVLVLARPGADSAVVAKAMDLLGNVAVLERPTRVVALVSAVRTALRSRQRQYQIRDHLAERERNVRAHALLAAIVESSDDAIISKTLDGIILSWNAGAQRIFGYTADEAIGRPITMLIPPELQHEEPVLLERLARGERIEHFETVRVTKSGQRIDVSLTVSPIRAADGTVIGASKVARDITQRKHAEAELRSAKEAAEAASVAKDNFLATLSHELRTPLTPVLATISAWEQAPDFPDKLRADTQMIRRNVDLEARLIDDLLDLTRIVKRKIALNLEVLDVHALLKAVLAMHASELDGNQLRVSICLEASDHFVRADPARLHQAFWNLLKNSAKFTAEGGRIEIQTSNDAQGRVSIVVQDNGIGISQDLLPRLFIPFEQGSEEMVKRYGGLGLGLAITKSLLDAQGGSITAESDGPGCGAKFIITLPAVGQPTDADGDSSERRASVERADGKSLRVLLVEDHADTARALARLLRINGHHVKVAESVQDALDAVAAEPFDVLVSDIGLPDGSGIDLIRRIRQHNERMLPAVALTGFGMEDDVARCREAGFDDHLTKPVNFQKLEDTIQRVGAGAVDGDSGDDAA